MEIDGASIIRVVTARLAVAETRLQEPFPMQPGLTPEQLLGRLEGARTLDDLQARLRHIFGWPTSVSAPDDRGVEPSADDAEGAVAAGARWCA